MENGIWELFLKLFSRSPAMNLQIFFGIIVLGIFAWSKFNSWTGKEDYFTKDSPPRHFTTWARYVSYATIYTIFIEIAYIVILVLPDLLNFHINLVNFLTNVLGEEFNKNLHIWAIVFLIGILPHVPGLKNIELELRYRLHNRAFIPTEAKALVQQFVENPGFFCPDSGEAKKELENINDFLVSDLDLIRPDNRLWHKYFKLVFLRAKIEKWQGRPVISRFFETCGIDYTLSKENYKSLKTDVKLYYDTSSVLDGKTKSSGERDYIERLRMDILREIENLLKRTYKVICCGILATERMHQKRLNVFKWFGLYPDFRPGIPVVIDIILKSALSVCMVTFATTLIFFHLSSPGNGLNVDKALSWAIIYTLMVGFCILGAVLLFRRLSRRSRFRSGDAAETFLVGPYAHRALAASLGYIIALSMLFIWFSPSWDKSFTGLIETIWPWAFIPATTSGFVVYYLSSLNIHRSRWLEGLLQGILTGGVALLVCIIAIENLNKRSVQLFIIYAVSTCSIAGYFIGFIFPKEYRHRVAKIYRGPDRRSHQRIIINSESTLKIGDEHYGCETEDLSLAGAKLSKEVPQQEGTAAILELPGVGEITGTISRKNDNTTCIKFSLTEAIKNSLNTYLGTSSFAHS
jgi:hypothetical protein